MNQYHVLTLFPEMIENGLKTSITGRAIEQGIIGLNAVNIRDFADNKHNKVDDYPYGGGAGHGHAGRTGVSGLGFGDRENREKGPDHLCDAPRGPPSIRAWRRSWQRRSM